MVHERLWCFLLLVFALCIIKRTDGAKEVNCFSCESGYWGGCGWNFHPTAHGKISCKYGCIKFSGKYKGDGWWYTRRGCLNSSTECRNNGDYCEACFENFCNGVLPKLHPYQ